MVLDRLRRACAVVVCLGASALCFVYAQPSGAYGQKTRTFHTAEDFARTTGGKVEIHRNIDPRQEALVREWPIHLPVNRFTVIAVTPPDVTWIGTKQGAIRFDRATNSIEYFAGLRWLPDDNVTGIGFDGPDTWLETSRGFARIERTPMMLETKSRFFIERVQARHNRWGLTADSHLRVPGDLSTNQMASTDNDGLWTAMYVAAECFRYRATGEPDAREHARAGMQAIRRLESITGIPGFPARSFIKVGVDE
jgi:hypothetical protein